MRVHEGRYLDVHLLATSLANIAREGSIGYKCTSYIRKAGMGTNDRIGEVVRVCARSMERSHSCCEVSASQKREVRNDQQMLVFLQELAHGKTAILHIAFDSVQRACILVVGMRRSEFEHIRPILWFYLEIHPESKNE